MKTYRINMRHNCGFFSDFLTILAGIMYCHDNDSSFFIDWRNTYYNFKNECNLFDKYFYQKSNDSPSFERIFNTLTPYGYYFKVNDENIDYLIKPSKIINEYDLLNNEVFKSIDLSIFNSKKVLGVHKRGTDHFEHGKILSDEYFLSKINEEFRRNSYDKIFLITDDLSSFEFFNRELGDDVITTNSVKTDGIVGLHKEGKTNGDVLSKDIIRDSYLLSKTNYKLITQSNVSTFSLLCNLNKDNFKYIDTQISYV